MKGSKLFSWSPVSLWVGFLTWGRLSPLTSQMSDLRVGVHSVPISCILSPNVQSGETRSKEPLQRGCGDGRYVDLMGSSTAIVYVTGPGLEPGSLVPSLSLSTQAALPCGIKKQQQLTLINTRCQAPF